VPVETRRYLGRGPAFPFRFGNGGGLTDLGGLRDSEARELVKQSLQQILGYTPGSRPMRRTFGTNMRSLLFMPNDPRLDAYIDFLVRQSIQRWEPRIEVGPIQVDRTYRERGILQIMVEFRIIRTNVVGNLVWPYYIDPEQRGSLGEVEPVGESAMTTNQQFVEGSS